MPLVKAMREGHSIPVNAVFDKEEGKEEETNCTED